MGEAKSPVNNEMGMYLNGLAMTKNVYKTEKGEKYSIDVACPGLRNMVSVGVEKDLYDVIKVMEPFSAQLSFSIFNGKVYFNRVN